MDIAQLETALRNADAAGDTDAARQLAQTIQKMRAEPEKPWQQKLMQNAAAGLVRGAGSIGATLLTPYDMLAGNTKSIGNPERRQAMDAALGSLGADTESAAYGVGKLGGEIAGTAGAGPVLAGLGRAIPGAARVAPVLDAIRTAGFSAGGATGLGGLSARTAGGAITGGAAAGMVNPEDAGTGAMIGGVLPGALQASGKAGAAVGRVIRGPQQSPELAAAIDAAGRSGYVIPPTQAKASLGNRLLEGLAGKLTTAQNASAKNQGVTNKLAAKALGLPADTALTPEVLADVRKSAGQSYQNVRGSGIVSADDAFQTAVNDIATKYRTTVPSFPGLGKTNMHGQPIDDVADLVAALKAKQFDASEAVDAIGILRERADKAFLSGDKTLGKANKDAAGALEDLIGRHLASNGTPDALAAFQQARQTIAKTYSIQKALNPASGSVDARKLGQQLAKGKPLSGDLADVARFGLQFPKAAQAVEGMGSLPQTSPLDWALAGGMTAATSNPLGMVGLVARPGARALALSPMVQSRLRQSPGLLNLPMDELARAGLLSGPVMAAD